MASNPGVIAVGSFTVDLVTQAGDMPTSHGAASGRGLLQQRGDKATQEVSVAARLGSATQLIRSSGDDQRRPKRVRYPERV